MSEVTGALEGAFTYDQAGSVTELSAGRSLTYDAARQVTSLIDATANTQTAYGYDARGNRTSAATTSTDGTASTGAVFDLANRLTTWTGADGMSTTYTYAATGLRASATTTTGEQTSTEQYTWNTLAGVPLLLTDASFTYVYGLGTAPLEQIATGDGTVDFLHTDLIGSVRSTTDATGQVTSDADYDAYGRPQPVTDTPTATITRFGYAGEYTDPTGLIYLRARYYDPQSAQFLSIDALVSQTAAPYGYTGGNPLEFVDPLGLWGWKVWEWSKDEWGTVGTWAGRVGMVATIATLTVATGGTALAAVGLVGFVASGVGAIASGAVAYHECTDGGPGVDCGVAIGMTAISIVGMGASNYLTSANGLRGTLWESAHVAASSRWAARGVVTGVESAFYGIGEFC